MIECSPHTGLERVKMAESANKLPRLHLEKETGSKDLSITGSAGQEEAGSM